MIAGKIVAVSIVSDEIGRKLLLEFSDGQAVEVRRDNNLKVVVCPAIADRLAFMAEHGAAMLFDGTSYRFASEVDETLFAIQYPEAK